MPLPGTPLARTEASIGLQKEDRIPYKDKRGQLGSSEYNLLADWAVAVDGMLRAGEVGGKSTTVVWRPAVSASDGDVYKTVGEAFEALAEVEGVAVLIIDPTGFGGNLEAFGNYPLACSTLVLSGVGQVELRINSSTFFNSDTICHLVLDAVVLNHFGTVSENLALSFGPRQGTITMTHFGGIVCLSGASVGQVVYSTSPLRIYMESGGQLTTEGEPLIRTTTSSIVVTVGLGCSIGPDVFEGESGSSLAVYYSSPLLYVQPSQTQDTFLGSKSFYDVASPVLGGTKNALTVKATSSQAFASNVSPTGPFDFDSDSQSQGDQAPTMVADGILINKAGLYRITARATWNYSAESGFLGIILVLNAVDPTGLKDADIRNNLGTETSIACRVCIDVLCEEGDIVKLYGYNTTGESASTNIGTAPYNAHIVPMLQVCEV